jgi:hypothetical protein
MMLGDAQGYSFTNADHRQIQNEPRRTAQQPLTQTELLTAPRLGEYSSNGDRHRDSPHEESADPDERPT